MKPVEEVVIPDTQPGGEDIPSDLVDPVDGGRRL